MAVFLGAKGGDILSSMRVASLLTGLKEKMAGKLAYLQAGEDVDLYLGLRGRINDELAFEKDFNGRFEMAMQELAQVEYPDQLPDCYARFTQMAREHFLRRGSVVAFHCLANAGHDLLLRKSLLLAEAGSVPGGEEMAAVPCCLLASGNAGRSELTLAGESRYFVVCRDTADADYCQRLKYRMIAIMRLCGASVADSRSAADSSLWLGTESQWQKWVQEQAGKKNLGETLATLGDLRGIAGAEAVLGSMKAYATQALLSRQGTETFFQAVRKMSSMPVALGIFGSFKTPRVGEHRGEFDLDDSALTPLVVSVRLLAIHNGIGETSTIDRVKGLVNGGHLGVDLAERLLKAYHVFTSHRIQKEMDAGHSPIGHFYLDPEQLSEEEQYRVKGGLETVVNLQRIIYQVFAEQG